MAAAHHTEVNASAAPHCRSKAWEKAKIKLAKKRMLPPEVGKFTRELDTALPGRHVKKLYDGLNRQEASILAQLRTGKTRLRGYLYDIGKEETEMCDCGVERETVEHFLFRCIKWEEAREKLATVTSDKQNDLSFHLGGKSAADDAKWMPDLRSVRATIRFVKDTGRFNRQED